MVIHSPGLCKKDQNENNIFSPACYNSEHRACKKVIAMTQLDVQLLAELVKFLCFSTRQWTTNGWLVGVWFFFYFFFLLKVLFKYLEIVERNAWNFLAHCWDVLS